jgi:hypothetical protein
MNNMLNKTCLAIVCITAIEVVALWRGIDGKLMGAAIAALAGLGGFAVGKYITKRSKKEG